MRLYTCFAALFALVSGTVAADTEKSHAEDPEYLIVGAGGSGLQMALFFEKYNYTYKILEKEPIVGSFWTKFPVFGEVISVNKITRDHRERLRYDWHSMLEVPKDYSMSNVTLDYFPQGKDWHQYMKTVSELAGIDKKIQHGVHVDSIATDGTPCVFALTPDDLDTVTKVCARRRVFVGTGMKEKEEPFLRALGGIPYSQITKDQALRRRVCILGNGNSGFEVAQNVYGVADRVTLYGLHPHRLSAVTRYTGDVRVKYLQVLENLNGKLLDTVDSFSMLRLPNSTGLEQVLNSTQIDHVHRLSQTIAWLHQFNCETFFITTGFKSAAPRGISLHNNFPSTSDWWRSTENPSVHFLGWLMHEQDFRRGAGGFFSGFRYLIRNLAHHIREEEHGIPYPSEKLSADQLVHKVIERFQTSSDLIILQDGVVVRDAAVPQPDGSYLYYEGINYAFHKDLPKDTIYMYFSWGDGRLKTSHHVFDAIYRFKDSGRLINLFLHPVIEINGRSRHIHEDLDMAWTRPAYVEAIESVIHSAIEGNLDFFTYKPKVPYMETEYNQTDYGDSNYYEPANLKVKIVQPVIQALWRSVYADGAQKQMEGLHDAMKAWHPELYSHEDMDGPNISIQ